MVFARNLALVALVALGVTVLPGGGNATEAVVTALSLTMLAAIGLTIARVWQETSLGRDVFDERQEQIFYAALGVLALIVVGTDELLDSGPGALVWIAGLGGSIAALVITWRAANSL